MFNIISTQEPQRGLTQSYRESLPASDFSNQFPPRSYLNNIIRQREDRIFGNDVSSADVSHFPIGAMSRRVTTLGPTNPSKTSVTLTAVTRGGIDIQWKKINSASANPNATRNRVMVGDILHYLVEARDAQGRPRISGGDYWFALLANDNHTGNQHSSSSRQPRHCVCVDVCVWRGGGGCKCLQRWTHIRKSQ